MWLMNVYYIKWFFLLTMINYTIFYVFLSSVFFFYYRCKFLGLSSIVKVSHNLCSR